MVAIAQQQEVWTSVCQTRDLVVGSGVPVFAHGESIAVFCVPATASSPQRLYAASHRDPFSGAEILAWGLLCEQGGEWLVASPMYKQHFRLRDGICLQDSKRSIRVWSVRLDGDWVQIKE